MQWLSQNWWWILLAVGFFFFLLRRQGGGMGHGMGMGGHPHSHHREGQPREDRSDRDPVNGHPIDRARALTTIFEGRTYYFDSEESRSEFNRDPQRFAGARVHRHHGC